MKYRETRNLALPDDPDQQIRYDFFLFLLLFPPYQPSTRNCVTHFKRKREKQTKEEESQVIFHLLLCCVGGRGRTFEFD
jgi:hypothetical protein